MDYGIMAEKKKNRLRDKSPNIILLFVIICSVLILMEISSHIAVEFETYNDQELTQTTIVPQGGPSPTYPPDFTPSSGYEMGD